MWLRPPPRAWRPSAPAACTDGSGPGLPRSGQGAVAGPGTSAGSRGAEARCRRDRPMVAVTLWLALTSDHLERPVAAAVYWGYLIAASMAIGAYWWTRRPASRFGPLLVAFGILVWVVSWQAADLPLAFDIGVLAEAPFFVLTFYLFLAFPMGRLEPSGRWLMWVLGFGVVAFFLPWALFSPVIAGGGPLTGCAPACPQNVLQVGSAPTVVEVAGKGETYLALAITAAVFVVYLARLGAASRPQRRTLMAVAVTSLLFLPAYFTFNTAAWVLKLEPDTLDALAWGIVAARFLLPLGFLIALLQAERFAVTAQHDLLDRLADRPDAGAMAGDRCASAGRPVAADRLSRSGDGTFPRSRRHGARAPGTRCPPGVGAGRARRPACRGDGGRGDADHQSRARACGRVVDTPRG